MIECKDTGIQSFHAYEIATDSGYHVGVCESEKHCTDSLARFQEFLVGEIETVALGTVEAESLESAIDKVRAGHWSYSQSC